MEPLFRFKECGLRHTPATFAVGRRLSLGGAEGEVHVTNILTPLVAIPGETDFSELKFRIRESDFLYGAFINDVVSFLLIGAGVFLLVVRPVNAFVEKRKTQPDVESPTTQCTECLSSIPVGARRCAFCTSLQGSGAPA
jgi:large conductance mechanosensitive channel